MVWGESELMDPKVVVMDNIYIEKLNINCDVDIL